MAGRADGAEASGLGEDLRRSHLRAGAPLALTLGCQTAPTSIIVLPMSTTISRKGRGEKPRTSWALAFERSWRVPSSCTASAAVLSIASVQELDSGELGDEIPWR